MLKRWGHVKSNIIRSIRYIFKSLSSLSNSPYRLYFCEILPGQKMVKPLVKESPTAKVFSNNKDSNDKGTLFKSRS